MTGRVHTDHEIVQEALGYGGDYMPSATLREQWELPALVVGSKADASACISAIRENGSLEPWLWDEGVRTWSESVPF